MEFYVRHSGVTYRVPSTQTSFTKGQWYHLMGMIAGSSGIKLSINGATPQVTSVDLGTFSALAANLTIGGDGTDDWDGAIDEVHIKNGINFTYLSAFTPPSSEILVAGDSLYLFHLNDNTGNQVYDEVSTSFIGNLNGGTWLANPFFAGTSHDVAALDVNISGAEVTLALGTSGSGAYVKFKNIEKDISTTDPTVGTQTAGKDCTDILIYQADNLNNHDVFMGLTNGIYLYRLQ